MEINTVYHYMRKLAKSDYYQNIYAYSKESNISLFTNNSNFTKIQIIFLTYLAFYHNLETDIYTGDVNELVLENEIYEDSYMMYKQKERKKNTQDLTKQAAPLARKEEAVQGKTFSWVFQSRKK